MRLLFINAVAIALLCPLGSAQEIKLLPSDGAEHHQFGRAVSVDSGTIIAGAPQDDDNGYHSGSAYLFDSNTGAQVAKLLPIDGDATDYFGRSVGIRGNIAIVGAIEDDDNGTDSGSAYLFDTSTGIQLAKLLPSDGVEGDLFGYSVVIGDDMAIVGSIGNNEWPWTSGAAYLFDAATGIQLAKLLPNDGEGGEFGASVDVSGTTAIIGARTAGGAYAGAAYLFDTTTGAQIAKLLPGDGGDYDYFGYSVAISGNTAIVGAPYNSDFGSYSGSAYLFDTTTGAQIAKLLPSDGDAFQEFGVSVDISGTTAIVGAWMAEEYAGSAYYFDTATGNQIAKLQPSDDQSYQYFGYAVAISGATAVTGAYGDTDNGVASGSAFLFDNDCDNNGVFDVLDIANDSTLDCDQSGFIDSCELAWLDRDCNFNGIYDPCECIAGATPDCNTNLIPDLCEGLPDCNSDGVPDECEPDCNSDGIPDNCDPGRDCDGDGLPDYCETDCDRDGNPDDCEPDCDGDGIPDDCEFPYDDCNGNSVPDECDIESGFSIDCNANDVPDYCDIWISGTSDDCNSNNVPDDCEPGDDCNSNGVLDDCELSWNDCDADGTPDDCQNPSDCDNDGALDMCDIASGDEPDLNGNGVPDSCECIAAASYCTGNPNTAGLGVNLNLIGLPSVSLNSLGIDAVGGIANQPGLIFHGPGTASQPLGEGLRCVSAPIIRVGPPVFFDGSGSANKPLDMNASSLSDIRPSDTRYFQLWYRDPQGGPFGFNLSNGLEVTFCP